MGAEAGVDPWSNVTRVATGAPGTVSLVEGSSFLVCDPRGDVVPGGSQGLFHRDTRFVSQLELLVDGARPEPLAARAVDPYSARFVLRLPWDGPGDSPLVAVRDRFVGDGLHEDVEITNHGLHPVRLEVELRIDADFADLFEVKRAGGGDAGVVRRAMRERGLLRWEYVRDGFQRATEVHLGTPFDQATDAGGHYTLTLSPGESWHTCVDVFLALDGERRMPKCRCGAFGTLASPLARRAAAWRDRLPSLRSGWDALDHLYRQGADDLAALLMEDPDGAGDLVVAAGLPWFMTLFGRDAIWTALMALPFDTELAGGVLRTLARHQGTREDPVVEEQPGKILHELRSGVLAARSGRSVYYGTVDATPLFVTLVAEAWRWGMAWEQVAALLPAVRRALGWMRGFGDPDGDGYLEYLGVPGHGLRNQGWKDSWDAIQHADGRLATGPVALCEVQGYKYRALLDAADLFEAASLRSESQRVPAPAGDGDAAAATAGRGQAEALRGEARRLAEQFRRDFWMTGAGYPAVALDGAKRQVDAVASNAAHLLWSGILTPAQERAVASRLVSPALFSGWGLRTLATSNRGYKPVSYHLGSVWPHDTAIAVAGLARAGFVREAVAVARGLLDAAPFFAYRLPELFSGFARDRFGFPVRYPTSCSPQAWAAASVLLVLRVLLGLEAYLPVGRLAIDPVLPPDALPLRLDGLVLGWGRLSFGVDTQGAVQVVEAPAGLLVGQ